MKNKIFTLFVLFLSFSQVGCFDWLDKENKAVSSSNGTSAISATQFTGISSATNKVTGVLITWTAVTDNTLVKAYNVYRVAGTKKTLLSTLAPSMTSYMDGTVVWGTLYTYQVKAVDQNNIEDSNTQTAKSVSWAGIDFVTASSRTSLIVNISNIATVVDEVRIYGQLGVGGPKILLAKGTGSDTEISITGLRKGYPYIISAQAYISALGKEDGNDVTFSAPTLTVGYDSDGNDLPQWGNVMQIRAFGEAPGAPADPEGTNKSPNVRVVELVFKAFSSMGDSAKYVVTRAAEGYALDSSATGNCTDTTDTSCRVCGNLTALSGVVTCRDLAVAASPAKYRYSLSLIHEDINAAATWIEALPSDQEIVKSYSVLVPIPPKNMVLVQRDAANYEMCLQLGKTPYPADHNRCIYSGIGAVPYSSGHNKPALNLPSGYYDFGYNLFVDRWPMACNWTSSERGGMCGEGHQPGGCIGAQSSTGYPSSTIGKVGDVYFMMTSSNINECFYAYSQDSSGNITWKRSVDLISIENKNIYLAMYTQDPGYVRSDGSYNTSLPGRRGKLFNNNWAIVAQQTCAAQTDSSYGQKRLSRAREYTVYSAPSLLTGELYPFANYTTAWNYYLQGSQPHSSYRGCDLGSTSYDPGTFSTIQDGMSALLDDSVTNPYRNMLQFKISSSVYGKRGYMIGAPETVDCMSRYGVADTMTGKWTNDMTYYTSTGTRKVTGIASAYDNGNTDFLTDISGGQTGFVLDATKFTSGNLYNGSANMTGFIPTLALPLTASLFSTDYWAKSEIVQPYGLSLSTGTTVPLSTAASAAGVYATVARYRWSLALSSGLLDGAAETHCVLPAE